MQRTTSFNYKPWRQSLHRVSQSYSQRLAEEIGWDSPAIFATWLNTVGTKMSYMALVTLKPSMSIHLGTLNSPMCIYIYVYV